MTATADIFGRSAALIGMVHVGALPGTPRHQLSVDQIVEDAVRDASALASAGFDAILLENMHDVPYLRRDVGPEIVAGMTAVAVAVRAAVSNPLGVQVLAGANRAAIAVAQAAGATFVRAEGFAFATVADEGLLDEADAGPLLRYRSAMGATSVHILADLKKKHSAHALTADVSLAETAQAAEFMGADGVIVTGAATGDATRADHLAEVRGATGLPLIVGSGATVDTVADLLRSADAVIVGSWIKRDGHWQHEVDEQRAASFVEAARRSSAPADVAGS